MFRNETGPFITPMHATKRALPLRALVLSVSGAALLLAVAGCGSTNSSPVQITVSGGPAPAAKLTPPPARFSFRGQDDPVGYVPEAASQAPNPPVASYNPDGTRVDCPAGVPGNFCTSA